MISHVFVGVNDFARAFKFYSVIMGDLGHKLKFNEPDNPWAGWMAEGKPRPLFLIGGPYDGHPARCGNGQMVALLADSGHSQKTLFMMIVETGGPRSCVESSSI